MSHNSNSEVFANLDLEAYKGMWIAVCESEIVSYGENVKKTFEEAQKKHPNKRIVIARVPEEQTMIY